MNTKLAIHIIGPALASFCIVACSPDATMQLHQPATTVVAGAQTPVAPNAGTGIPAAGTAAPRPAIAGSPASMPPLAAGVGAAAAGQPSTGTAGSRVPMAGTTAMASAANGGTGAVAGAGGSAMMTSGAGGGAAGSGTGGTGMCCANGDCLCHGEPVADLTYKAMGPYKTMSYSVSTGKIFYPTDAEAPFAAMAIVPGFLNTGPEMEPWGTFYASYGIVLMTANTGAADQPDMRATLLSAAVKTLQSENTKMGSALFGKLSGRYGTSGYSMGGGGTTIAAGKDATLKVDIGLAAWGGNGMNIKVPTLLLCGSADTTAGCGMASPVYTAIAEPTPKMMVTIQGATHFNWFSPDSGERGKSGMVALAFAKVFLEGDERWKTVLLKAGGMTNIK